MIRGVFFLLLVYALRRTWRMRRAQRIARKAKSRSASACEAALNPDADTVSVSEDASQSSPRWLACEMDSGKTTTLHERDNHV